MESQPPVPPEIPPVSPPPAPPALPPASASPLPWEQPGAPLLGSFFATIHLLLFRPREAFARMAPAGSYARPIAFALALGIPGMCVSAGYQALLGDPMQKVWSRFGEGGGPDLPRFVVLLVGVFASPFLVALGVGISTLLYHLVLAILGGSGGGLGGTFRVVCYGMAGNVWVLLPFVGGLVAGVWIAVASIIGLAVVHRTSLAKASAAVLLPFVLCCACCAPLVIWRVMSRM